MVDILSAMTQDHQWYNIIKCDTIFLQLNYTQIKTEFTETLFFYQIQSNIQYPKTIFLIMYNSTNTRYGYNENITISTEATTIPVFTSLVVTKFILETSIQSIVDLFKIIFDKQN